MGSSEQNPDPASDRLNSWYSEVSGLRNHPKRLDEPIHVVEPSLTLFQFQRGSKASLARS